MGKAADNRPERKGGLGPGAFVVGVLVVAVLLGIFANSVNSRRGAGAGNAYGDWIGKLVPDFSVVDINGERITLSELKGTRVVVVFWATWCPPCVMEIPYFIEMQEENLEADLMIIAISNEYPETVRSFARRKRINYRVVSLAGGLPRPFGDVVSLPTTFFIDRNGILQSAMVKLQSRETLRAHALAGDYEAGSSN